MTLIQDAPSIMHRLRADTRPLHDAAEQSSFQRALLAGSLPRERYVDSLGQLLFVHRALEGHLRRRAAAHPAIAAVVREEHFQEENLCRDLDHFGRDAAAAVPLPATRALISAIDRTADDNPVSLLGYHYVLEGSKNGAKFLVDRVRAAYGLSGPHGVRYLDPYGSRQREVWAAFRRDMDAVGFSAAETAGILAAAAAMFAGITRLYDGVLAAAPE